MKFQQIRSAAVKVIYDDVTFLVDPWLQDKGKGLAAPSPDPVKNAMMPPLVELPFPAEEVLKNVDAIIVTHVHPDHFTPEYIPKDICCFVKSAEDEKALNDLGFANTKSFAEDIEFKGVTLHKTGGLHGTTEETIKAMGEVAGVVLTRPNEKTIYIAGDTVWCPIVAEVIETQKPDVIVLNANDAELAVFGRLVMDKNDVELVYKSSANAFIIASHMDTVNHGFITKKEMREFINEKKMTDRVLVPEDGEMYIF